MLHCDTGGSLCFLVFLFVGLSVSDAVDGPLYKQEGSAHKLTFLFLLKTTQLHCSLGLYAVLIWLSESVCPFRADLLVPRLFSSPSLPVF